LGHEDRRPNAVNVRYWHLADIPETAINVRFRAKADIKEMTAYDPKLTSGDLFCGVTPCATTHF